jgi:AcrR family transcriptional regulator
MASPHPQDIERDHRHRLLDAMAQSVALNGFANTTITDVVTLARVSRRTFYEHFGTREACLIALFEAASIQAFKVLAGSINPTRDWRDQLDDALYGYLSILATQPALLKTLFVAVFALGDEGLAARRRNTEKLVDFIEATVAAGAPQTPTPDRAIITAIVGGIHELILQAIERGEESRLTALVPTVVQFLRQGLDRSNPGRDRG